MAIKWTRRVASVGFIAFVVVASSCKTNSGLVTPQPPVITDQDQCAKACDNLKLLGCDEGLPIDMGKPCNLESDCKDLNGNWDHTQTCALNGECITTCTQFCIQTENSGVWLDPTCVKTITKCADIDKCPAPVPKPPVNTCVGPACDLPGNK